MKETALDLLLEIARCPNIQACLAEGVDSHPCAPIVRSQGKTRQTLANFQAPEPWSGDLHRAPILFLGSNPSIGYQEEYPLYGWSDENIADFFVHRFGGGPRQWVKDGLYVLCKDGNHSTKWVRYWAATRKRAAELLGRNSVEPGVDYVISEVVHCKSRHEHGVKTALEQCGDKYLERLLEASGAKVIACLGRLPAYALRKKWGIPREVRFHGPIQIGERERFLVFLRHPNARGPKSLASQLDAAEIERLRLVLGK